MFRVIRRRTADVSMADSARSMVLLGELVRVSLLRAVHMRGNFGRGGNHQASGRIAQRQRNAGRQNAEQIEQRGEPPCSYPLPSGQTEKHLAEPNLKHLLRQEASSQNATTCSSGQIF